MIGPNQRPPRSKTSPVHRSVTSMNRTLHLAFMGVAALALALATSGHAADHHVATTGDDANAGTAQAPFRTIQRAANAAQPGDSITVHAGTYRERVNPPRGGSSDAQRITYQAAPGERVEIKGSEVVTGWSRLENDTWTVTLPNAFFKDFNPYADLIHGDWFAPKGREHHTGAVYLDGAWLAEAATLDDVRKPADPGKPLWFGRVGDAQTTLWAQFPGVEDPNSRLVEINVRRTVFYPDRPGRNFITVRGFALRHAATPWAPPTAEQIGLIGTHWSQGWIIENNIVSHSICSGIALGKHGDAFDNTSADTAEGYVKTIERAHAFPIAWARENIGHHIVRDNTVSHCEQAGIVGSLGPIFCVVTGNTIHDIHVRQAFTGAEMAGIKFHAAIDTEISGNHIYRTCRGLWLDWMAQGTRVTGNLFHENQAEDLFVEVNHGPFLVDNNVFLSPTTLLDMSEGGAFVHNLIAGRVVPRPELNRETPFHPPHSTAVAGLRNVVGGDVRFFNNLIVAPGGLAPYDNAALPPRMAGNVYLAGARPSKHEADPLVVTAFNPALGLDQTADATILRLTFDPSWVSGRDRPLVTTDLLGAAAISKAPYQLPDGSPIRIDRDALGHPRDPANPTPGPFETPGHGPLSLKLR
jgi:alpha-N-arabinofuranosidase